MKPLLIDFAPRQKWWQAGSDRRLRPLWIALSAFMLVLFAAVFLQSSRLEHQRAEVKSQLDVMQAAMTAAQEEDTRTESVTLDSAEAVAQANSFLNYPWPTLFSSLEHSLRPEVHLVSMELGVMRQSSKLVVDANDANVALEYLDALRDEPGFATVALAKQEAITGQGEARMRFTIETPSARGAQRSSAAKGAQ